MRFIIIGITDNPQPFFPPEVLDIIKNGRVFSGGKRHHAIVASYLPADAQWIDIIAPLDDVFHLYEQCHASLSERGNGDEAFIVFVSGDPLFFGFANTIRQRLPKADVVLYPSFNSLQMLAHRLVMPYHDMRIVSLTGRPWPAFDRAVIERTVKIGVLTDREHTPAAIACRLIDYGYTYYDMYVGEHLGHPEKEIISKLTLEQAAQRTFDYPNCLILSAKKPLPAKPFGIPDTDFVLLDGRKRMITKMPIRLLALQALDLSRKQVFWDIGFCTGSVSVEARLLFPHLHIEAFEIREEGRVLIEENARRHGTPGIEIHIGDFCDFCCNDIEPDKMPDAVFIGGHGGRLKEIMTKVVSVMKPGGCMVMNSVTEQSRLLFEEACHELGLEMHQPLHIAINDYNPIDILKCELP